MRKTRRLRRWLLLLFVLGLLLFLGVRTALTSRFAAQTVARQLEQKLGTPVRLGSVQLGLFGTTTLENLELRESEGETTWLAIEHLTVDVSVLDALSGAVAPQHLNARGVTVHLHFDQKGTLLTHLPTPPESADNAPLPAMQVREGKVRILQDGKPALEIVGLSAQVTSTETALQLSADINDPQWGNWQVTGTHKPESGAFGVTVHTGRVHLTPERVRTLPLLDPRVSQHLSLEGDSAAELSLSREKANSEPRLVARFRPEHMRLVIHLLELEIQQTTGEVLVQDDHIDLHAMRGETAQGILEIEGQLRLTETPSRFALKVAVNKVDLQKLPSSWQIPTQLAGRLSGNAEVVILAEGEHLRTTGTGRGVIEDAQLAGFETQEPIQLRLTTDAQGVHLVPAEDSPWGAGWVILSALTGSGNSSGAEISQLLVTSSVESLRWMRETLENTTLAMIVSTQVLVTSARTLEVPRWTVGPHAQLHAQVGVRAIDLERLTRVLGLESPVPLRGTGNLRVEVSIPVDRPTSVEEYRLEGVAELPRLQIDTMELHEVRARVRLERGVLQVLDLQAKQQSTGGEITGSIHVALFPRGDARGSLKLRSVPLPPLLARIQGLEMLQGGLVSGTLTAEAPLEHLPDFTLWHGSGALEIERIKLASQPLDWVRAKLSLRQGQLHVTEMQAVWQGIQARGAGNLGLTAPFSYQFQVELPSTELEVLRQLAPQLTDLPPASGQLHVLGEGAGTFQPFAVHAQGTAQITNLNTALIRSEELTFAWQADQTRIEIADIHTVALEIDRWPLEEVRGSFLLHNGQTLAYRLEAELLGGHVHLEGRSVPSPAGEKVLRSGAIPAVDGSIRLEEVSLGRLWEVNENEVLGDLRGDLDFEGTYHFDAEANPSGSGRVRVSRLRWERLDLSPEMRAELRLQGKQLDLSDMSGTIAQGFIRARASLQLDQMQRSWFELHLDRVDSARLIAALPRTKGALDGPLELRVRGSLGPVWRANGQIQLSRGKVYGVEVVEWRVPFRATFSPPRGTGQVEVHDMNAQVALGRVVGDASWGWGLSNHLKGSIRFYHVDLPRLLKPFVQIQQLGQGRMSGRLDVDGRHLHSFQDLRASLDADLRHTQALEFPVLRQVSTFLPRVSTNTLFQEGKLRATMTRGVVRLQKLALSGALLDMFVDGSITLPQGQLRMEVTAQTPQFTPDPLAVRVIGSALLGPLSGEALARASSYLASRVVHLHVTGTFRNPTIRFEPVRLLTDEAVRFFLLRTSVTAPASSSTR